MTHTEKSEANLPVERYGGFYEAQGLTVRDIAPGDVVIELNDPRDDQRGGGGTAALNGGVIAYMFDGAMGAAIASLIIDRFRLDSTDDQAFGEATISLTINYVKPAMGTHFEAHGHAVRAGRSIAFADAKILDEHGDVCATASGVWRIFLRS
ncbi:MAG: PaaI family thioesterase [Nitrolancea sp.]